MDENKKYSVIGSVTIGTDEYRDLVKGIVEAKAEASKQTSRRWDVEHELSTAKTRIESLEGSLAKYAQFMKENSEIADSYTMWVFNKEHENDL